VLVFSLISEGLEFSAIVVKRWVIWESRAAKQRHQCQRERVPEGNEGITLICCCWVVGVIVTTRGGLRACH